MEKEIKKDENISEFEACKQKCEEYLNNWKRERADFLNYKKDEMERMAMLGKYAKEDMILKILPILDNIELAEKHSDILQNVGMSEWTKGFLQIKKQAEELLKKEGIEEIETIGQKFDPTTMEIVDEVLSIEYKVSGIVVEEVQKGYKMEEKVLRPSKVKVSK